MSQRGELHTQARDLAEANFYAALETGESFESYRQNVADSAVENGWPLLVRETALFWFDHLVALHYA